MVNELKMWLDSEVQWNIILLLQMDVMLRGQLGWVSPDQKELSTPVRTGNHMSQQELSVEENALGRKGTSQAVVPLGH